MSQSTYHSEPPRSLSKPSRQQRGVVVIGIVGFVLILVMLQLWLLTATMNAFLGGDSTVILPAALASTTCLLLNLGLLRYLWRMERHQVE